MVAMAINIEINNSTVLAQVKLINWKKYLQNSLSDLVSFHLIKMSSKSSHKRHSTINTFWIIHLRWRSNDCGIVSNSTIKHTRACARLTALCPWLPGWAGTRKVKPNLDFTEATHSEWQWHQLGHMHVCTSLQTDNHASTPPLCFLQAGCPSCHPTNSVKALKAQHWWHFLLPVNGVKALKLKEIVCLICPPPRHVCFRLCWVFWGN